MIVGYPKPFPVQQPAKDHFARFQFYRLHLAIEKLSILEQLAGGAENIARFDFPYQHFRYQTVEAMVVITIDDGKVDFA